MLRALGLSARRRIQSLHQPPFRKCNVAVLQHCNWVYLLQKQAADKRGTLSHFFFPLHPLFCHRCSWGTKKLDHRVDPAENQPNQTQKLGALLHGRLHGHGAGLGTCCWRGAEGGLPPSTSVSLAN